MEASPISDCLLRKEEELQKAFFSACRLEEEFWRQKSRSLWLLSGDKNTRYFHKQAKARKNFKAIFEIDFQGDLIKDSDGIKKAAMASFQELFTAPIEDPLDTISHPFDLIPSLIKPKENIYRTVPVTMNELK